MERGIIQAVDHVRLEAPSALRAQLEEELRWFYGELIGLVEQPPGKAGDDSEALSFRSEQRLKLTVVFVENPTIDPVAIRMTYVVRSLRNARASLGEQGFEVEMFTGQSRSDRALSTLDPIGHRVLIRQDGSLYGI